jgi:hypothetical protein
MKKEMNILIVVGIIAIALFFIMRAPTEEIEPSVDDKGVRLRVFAFDADKNPLGELKKEVRATIGGGPTTPDVAFIQLGSEVIHTDSRRSHYRHYSRQHTRPGNICWWNIGIYKSLRFSTWSKQLADI